MNEYGNRILNKLDLGTIVTIKELVKIRKFLLDIGICIDIIDAFSNRGSLISYLE